MQPYDVHTIDPPWPFQCQGPESNWGTDFGTPWWEDTSLACSDGAERLPAKFKPKWAMNKKGYPGWFRVFFGGMTNYPVIGGLDGITTKRSKNPYIHPTSFLIESIRWRPIFLSQVKLLVGKSIEFHLDLPTPTRGSRRMRGVYILST